VSEEILLDVVKLVAGLQVPVSMGMPLGTALEPWTRLKDKLQGFGWLSTDPDAYIPKLKDVLGVPDAHWRAVLTFLADDCGLDAAGTETLIRLVASVFDDVRRGSPDAIHTALQSFSEPDEVEALATGVGIRLYPEDP
jgi:hypothetical protein